MGRPTVLSGRVEKKKFRYYFVTGHYTGRDLKLKKDGTWSLNVQTRCYTVKVAKEIEPTFEFLDANLRTVEPPIEDYSCQSISVMPLTTEQHSRIRAVDKVGSNSFFIVRNK